MILSHHRSSPTFLGFPPQPAICSSTVSTLLLRWAQPTRECHPQKPWSSLTLVSKSRKAGGLCSASLPVGAAPGAEGGASRPQPAPRADSGQEQSPVVREVLQQMTAGCSKRQQGVLTAQNQNHRDKPRVLAGPRGLRAGPPGLGPGLWLEPHLCLCAMSPSASLTQDSLTPRPLIQELLKTPCHAGHSAGLRDGAWNVRACIQPTTPRGCCQPGGVGARDSERPVEGLLVSPTSPVEGASPGSCVWGVGPGRLGSSVPFGFVSGGGVMLAADPQRPPKRAASQQIHKTPRPSGVLGQWDNLQYKSPTQYLH